MTLFINAALNHKADDIIYCKNQYTTWSLSLNILHRNVKDNIDGN